MKLLKTIGKVLIGIFIIAILALANNPMVQTHITNLIDKLI